MCNLSEGIWEKGLAEGMNQGLAKGLTKGKLEGIAQGKAEGISEGQLLQLTRDVKKLLSKGMKYDDILNFLDITPDLAVKIREKLNI